MQRFKIQIDYIEKGYFTSNDIVDSIIDNLDVERKDVHVEEY